MIIPIPNQPINLEEVQPDDCNLGDQKKYCALYTTEDTIYWQGKQTPCGNDLNCAPKFGFNLVNNGDFALNLDGWTNEAGAWYWSTSGATIATSGVDVLYQPISGFVSGQSYEVTFEVVNRTAGGVKVSLNGGSFGTNRTADGTYTEMIVAGSDTSLGIKFTTSGTGFSGSITNIVITGDTACVTANGNWLLGESACYLGGGVDNLIIAFTPVENTGYYQFIIHVKSMTAGSLQVFDAASGYYGAITANGVYTFYGILSGNELHLFSDAAFDGCVSEVNIYELRQDIQVHITDNDGAILADITNFLSYTRDRLILKMLWADTLLDPGCYRIAVQDLCNEDNFALLSEINGDVGFDSPGSWTIHENVTGSGASSTVISGSKITQTHGVDVGSSSMATRAYSWVSGYYIVKVTIETGTVQPTDNNIGFAAPAGINGWYQWATFSDVVSNTFYTKQAVVQITNDNPSTAWSINMYNKLGVRISAQNGSNGDIIELKSFSIKAVELDVTTFPWLSNCFSVEESHDCAKLIQGWENAPDNSGIHAQGFLFPDQTGGAFRISSRYRLLQFNPTYPTDADDYEYSDGSRSNSFSKREKYKEALFDYCDETALDSLTACVLFNKFQIDGEDYYVKTEDFKPDWDKEGRQNLAQIRMLARKKTSTIYNNKR